MRAGGGAREAAAGRLPPPAARRTGVGTLLLLIAHQARWLMPLDTEPACPVVSSSSELRGGQSSGGPR